MQVTMRRVFKQKGENKGKGWACLEYLRNNKGISVVGAEEQSENNSLTCVSTVA